MRYSVKAREVCLRLLFQWQMSKEAPDRVKELYWKQAKSAEALRKMADSLFDVVVERVEEIDPLIEKHLANWRVERLSAVDRNIMRIAVWELLHRTDIRARTIIDAAIELARLYSADDSVKFINGVLDAIRRTLKREDDE